MQKTFEEHLQREGVESGPGYVKRTSKGHGRQEERYCCAIPAPPTRRESGGPGHDRSGVDDTNREGVADGGAAVLHQQPAAKAKRLLHAVRSHWGIENGLHWVLDVAYDEDRRRVRKNHGPANLANLHRLSLSLLKQDRQTAGGIVCKRKKCGWDEQYMIAVLAGRLSELLKSL